MGTNLILVQQQAEYFLTQPILLQTAVQHPPILEMAVVGVWLFLTDSQMTHLLVALAVVVSVQLHIGHKEKK
jgi:hypothetical protein